jgi:hypothetical protein
MNTTFRAQGDLREANDGYRGEIYRSGDWRIIVCKDAIQLILQRRTRAASPDGARWEGIHYFRRRDTALRLWRTLTGEGHVVLMAILPERFNRAK